MGPSHWVPVTHNASMSTLFASVDEPWLYGDVGFRFLLSRMGLYRRHTRPAERSGAVVSGTRRGGLHNRSKTLMTDILMPKATAVWLVDNTSLTFEQIADFCGLHPLEVRGMADGDVARDIRGADPLVNGQLTREELDRAQDDSSYRMKAV